MRRFEIIDIYLEGFAKIHTGMHVDRIYLNFEEMPYQTYLFVGDSGSGKSSVLKSIHPFAFNNGTGDESASSDLIMSGRSGRKIIRYRMDRDIITCSHIFNRKDSTLQVKSFFAVNDEELNPSGLVTTFKDFVMQYFYIDESFLSLLALGNSVKSLVEYTAGERKKFAVRIFTELNVFMTYYKNATAVVRELDTVLSNVVDKLKRYSGYDKNDIKKELKGITAVINELESKLDVALQSEGAVKSSIETNKESYQQYEQFQDNVTELLKTIESLKLRRKTTSDIAVLENDEQQITKNIITTELRVESLQNTLKSELDFKEMKLMSMKNLEESLSKMESGINKVELEKLLANVDAELAGLEDVELLDGVDYGEKKERMITANIYLDELRGIATDLVTEVRDSCLIPEVLEGFLDNKRYEQELDISIKAAMERITNLENANHLKGKIRIQKITKKPCDIKDCPYKKFYEDCTDILTIEKDKADMILIAEESRLQVAEDRKVALYVIKKLYSYIEKHSKQLKIVPVEIFDPNTFVKKFMTSMDRQVCDVGLMGSTISYLEQAVRKSQLLILQKTTRDQIAGIQSTVEVFNSMKDELARTERTIAETEDVIQHHQNDLEYNQKELETLNSSMKEIHTEITLARDLETYRGTLKDTQKALSGMEESKKKHDALSSKLTQVQTEVGNIRTELNERRSRLNQLNNMLETIQSLENEQKVLSSRYSEAVLIRDAVSPSKGIPVEFIDDVIRNQMIDSINELMHVAYPDITLIKDQDKLIINEKEFTIPYKKNGVIIGDISEASDGERAMLSLAFSLVLIRLVSKVYNIMLLDEMDTALDKYGRSKYIDIIEQYMKTISASQIFLISHNSMFDMYNVNILRTTSNEITHWDDSKYIVDVFKQTFAHPNDTK